MFQPAQGHQLWAISKLSHVCVASAALIAGWGETVIFFPPSFYSGQSIGHILPARHLNFLPHIMQDGFRAFEETPPPHPLSSLLWTTRSCCSDDRTSNLLIELELLTLTLSL
jgi:hypothetical protein